jgi:hypothetical protein
MKTSIVLGLGVLCLLVVRAWDRTSPEPMSDDNPAATKSPHLAGAKIVREVGSHPRPEIVSAQPVHAMVSATVESDADPDRLVESLEHVAKSISEAELSATLDLFAHDADPEAAELCQLLVRRWAESDPSAAAAWTSELPEGSLSKAASEQIAIAWANTDLPAAADWVLAMPEGDARHAATLVLAYEASRSEPIAALLLAETLPPSDERDHLLVHAVSQWAGTDSTAAATWVTEVPDPALSERLVAAVAIVLAEEDAVAAGTLVVNRLAAGNEQDRAVVAIVQRWAQYDPQAAAGWVSQFPDISSRDAAVRNLMALWTVQDAEAAALWLSELPVGPMRDAGIAAYAETLADGDRTSRTDEQDSIEPAAGGSAGQVQPGRSRAVGEDRVADRFPGEIAEAVLDQDAIG